MSTLLDGDTVSSWGENPLLHVTRLCLSFAQSLFAQAPRGEGCFFWDADETQTEVLITDKAPLESEMVGHRPAIVFIRSPMAFAGAAMDQMQSMNMATGERKHTDLLSGNATYNCVGRHKNTAEYLAWILARHCWILRRIMLKSGFHDFGQRIQLMSASPPGALIQGAVEGEAYNVPVVVPFYFQWQDTITQQELRKAEAIEVQMQTAGFGARRVTAAALDGSPGPGMRGSALGARTGPKLSGSLKPPSLGGRPLAVEALERVPDSQPLTLKIRT
jgi:hypothetical protein